VRHYPRRIDESCDLPLAEALMWEKRQVIATAWEISTMLVAARREAATQKGRSDTHGALVQRRLSGPLCQNQ
jgi:hypothetical protein